MSDIEFLSNQKIDFLNLPYIEKTKKIYVNLYELKIKKQIRLCQYPYSVTPQIETGDFRIRDKIFKVCHKLLKEIYGECFISGDSIYGLNKVDESQIFKAKIYLKKATEYTLNIKKCAVERIIKQEDNYRDQVTKQFIELLIRDILHSNPKLDYYKGLFLRKDRIMKLETENVSIKFYPGFTTNFVETESGIFLNVILKNKIIQADNILDFLNNHKYKNVDNQNEIKNILIGRSFKFLYTNKNYKINDILFDSNPQTQKTIHDGQSITIIDYYEIVHKLKIKDIT